MHLEAIWEVIRQCHVNERKPNIKLKLQHLGMERSLMVKAIIELESGIISGVLTKRLDIGCGASPTGTVNVDLMLDDHDEKWDLNPHGYNNFVKAMAEYLPFINNCFDEVYSSHLLEHLDNPDLALAEMLRVSKYIVKVVLPFALFQLLDIFYWKSKFWQHRLWLRKHHKRNYFFNPLKRGSCRFHFLNLKEALLYKKKAYGSWLKVPIPFETLTVILKHELDT